MISKIIIAATFLLNYGYVESSTNPLTIQGGSAVNDKSYNFMAYVLISPECYCGGSIVTRKLVITAAHCIYIPQPQNIIVHVGSLILREGGQTSAAINKFIPDNFNPNTKVNDIGFLLLRSSLNFNDAVGAIDLPIIGEFDFNPGSTVTALGFGELGDGSRAQILQEVTFDITDNGLCEALNSEFCIWSEHRNIKLRKGDDGGPIIRTINQVTKLIGIVSSFEHPSGSRFSVIVRVPNYHNFTQPIMGRHP